MDIDYLIYTQNSEGIAQMILKISILDFPSYILG